jgi:exodeoxyribonuclease VII small subunit
MKFEDKIKRIEEIADKMEEQNVELDTLIKLYEEGMKLTKDARSFLEKAELKISKINGEEVSEVKNNEFD